MKLRSHQAEMLQIINGMISGESQASTIIVEATPGSGKSLLPIIAGRLIPAGLADALCWIVPRKTLQFQAEANFQDLFFRKMLKHKLSIRASTNDTDPCRGLAGFSTTYQALAVDDERSVLSEFKSKRYILVLDEVHHVSADDTDQAWHDVIEPLVENAKYVVLMTGTLQRGDGKKIAFMPYLWSENKLTPDMKTNETTAVVEYTRADALAEKAIIPLSFHLADGSAKWIDKDGAFRNSGISSAPRDIASQAVFTAISTDFAEALLDECLTHWQKLRKTNPNAKLMVVTANYEEAKKVAKALADKWFFSEIATSHESAHAQEAIKKFKNGMVDVLVSINICYEGLDVPEITHIACLTNIRSVPWIEQMVARAVRIDTKAGAYSSQIGYIYAPDDVAFRDIVKKINSEQSPFVKNHIKQQTSMFDEESEPGGGGGSSIKITPLGSSMNGQREVFLGGNSDYSQEVIPTPETPSEIEASLRDKIERHVRQFSFANRYNPKRLNTEIKRHFDKPRDKMTSPELQKVLSHVTREYPLQGKPPEDRAEAWAMPRGGGRRVSTKAVLWEETLRG